MVKQKVGAKQQTELSDSSSAKRTSKDTVQLFFRKPKPLIDSIVIGSDHAGFKLKTFLIKKIAKQGLNYQDVGASSEESVDYPLFAKKVAGEVIRSKGVRRGVLICGTGIGMSIAANRFKGIRATLVHNAETATLARTHNDSNILVLSGNLSQPMAVKVLNIWLTTPFSNSARHKRRIEQLDSA